MVHLLMRRSHNEGSICHENEFKCQLVENRGRSQSQIWSDSGSFPYAEDSFQFGEIEVRQKRSAQRIVFARIG